MFDNYLYVSSTASSFRKHFEDAANKYISKFNLNENSLVVDIGSNDGIALKPLMEKGIKVVGVEPARNIADIANKNNITTINDYFGAKIANRILVQHGKAKIVTASNVFAHSDELKSIALNALNLLEDDGVFIIEVQYLLDTIKDLTFDNIYHEHVNYWSVTALKNFFESFGAFVVDVEHIDTHGGSIRVYVAKNNENIYHKLWSSHSKAVDTFIQNEESFGLAKFQTYVKFGEDVANIKNVVRTNISKLKERFGVIAGYGSPAKATTSLNYFNINTDYIDYTIEDNQLKNGKYIPGVDIPIKDKTYMKNHMPKAIVVLAWNFFDLIKKNNQDLVDAGVVFVNIKDLYDSTFDVNSL
jgi:SAM-dependent methyltransferase